MTSAGVSCRGAQLRAAGGRARGFSFIELMVVLAMLGLLATMVAPVAQLTVQRSKEARLREALREIRRAIDAYHEAAVQGAIVLPAGAPGYPPTLETLVLGVNDQRQMPARKLYFLRRIPRDPFHDGGAASDADTWRRRAYASSAADPREGADVYDVRSGSERIGLNGQPYSAW